MLHKCQKLVWVSCFMVILLLVLAFSDMASVRLVSVGAWVNYLVKITYATTLLISWFIIAYLAGEKEKHPPKG